MDSGGGKNICTLHRCHDCKDEVLDIKKKKDLLKCFRCPKAYDRKHRPRDVHVLGNEYFLCIQHVNEEENIPELGKDIMEKMEKRKQVHKIFSHINNSLLIFYFVCIILDQAGPSTGKVGRPLIRKALPRPSATAIVPVVVDGDVKPVGQHVLPPKIRSRIAIRSQQPAGTDQSAQSASTGSQAAAINEASITIARRKRPAPVPAMRPHPFSRTCNEGSGYSQRDNANYYGQSSGAGGYHVYPSQHGAYPHPPIQSQYNSSRGANMFFHGGGGHFLHESDLYSYDDEYVEPHYDDYSVGCYSGRSEVEFNKRRRFGMFSHNDYMPREDLMRFGMSPDMMYHRAQAAHLDSYYPPEPTVYSSGPLFDSGMGRTAALLAESAVPTSNYTSFATNQPISSSLESRIKPHELVKPATVVPTPPESKKIDPNDLFALLSANGLFGANG